MLKINHLYHKETVGATLLITGCCIGAGMIGLPIISALAGFMPSSLAMLFCYFFTTITGLLLLEATLWFDQRVNLMTIAEYAFGKFGKIITAILFLFLFYCLFVAYLDGGGTLLADSMTQLSGIPISNKVGIIACMLLVIAILYSGTKNVDKLNRYLLVGLIISYFTLLIAGMPRVQATHLTYTNWMNTAATIPIILICFGYQNLVPSIAYYLNKNVNAIRFAIIIGNALPFFVYLLWNIVILGVLPTIQANTTEANIMQALAQGSMGYASISHYIKAFSLFALLTSFLPSAISFIDFIKDGFKHSLTIKAENELILYILIFTPPVICALLYPHIFLQALSFAGGFIDILLFGILPALIILVGRTKQNNSTYQVIGGKILPFTIIILSCLIMYSKF